MEILEEPEVCRLKVIEVLSRGEEGLFYAMPGDARRVLGGNLDEWYVRFLHIGSSRRVAVSVVVLPVPER